MRWQTLVRGGLGLSLIGVGVLVYLQLQDRPTAAAPPSTAPIDGSATSVSEGGVLRLHDVKGTLVVSINYQTKREFADRRTVFDKPDGFFIRQGVKHDIKAERATMQMGPNGERPDRVIFDGGVRLTAADGTLIETAGEATYLDIEQKVLIPGDMTFTKGALSGRGIGAELFMDRSVLWINSQAHLEVAPEAEGGTPVVADATRIGLADADAYMVLEGNAVMTHGDRRLSANNARVTFAQVGRVAEFIELRGQSAVRSLATRGRRPVMTAENINLAFAPETGRLANARLVQNSVIDLRDDSGVTSIKGSEVDMFMAADGETLTRLQVTAPAEVLLPQQPDRPARKITSNALVAEGEEGKGLTRATFNGAVDYRETRVAGRGQAASTRTATAQSLVLALAGDLDDVQSAVFRRAFRLVDGEVRASAEEGHYDAKAETLKLRGPADAPLSEVTDGRMDVDAWEIDVDLKGDAFAARGRADQKVSSTLVAKSKEKTGGGLFESGKDVAGTSDRLSFTKASGRAVYEGRVFLVQGDSSLSAELVEFDDANGNLSATGSVASRLALDEDSKGAGAKPGQKPVQTQTRITANQLRYADAARRAVYTGNAVLDASTGERMRGDEITLELDAKERKLKTAFATAVAGAEVRVALLEGRQTAGQRVDYTAATDEYVVSGTPAIFAAPDADRGPGECSVGSGTTIYVGRTDGNYRMQAQGGAVGRMRPVKCAEVMKVIK